MKKTSTPPDAGEQARAFWISAPGRGELRSEPLPQRGSDQVRVRALYSGISRGTESLIFNGRVPPSQYAAMRAPFQSGDFPAPVKYGYSSVGVVEAGPPTLRDRTVFCLYPHQDRYVVPAAAVTPLPAALPPARAVLAANAETALNGLWDAAPRLGDRVAVIGAGTIGLLTAYLASRLPACEVQLIDVDTAGARAEAAARLGLRLLTPQAASGDVDLAIHASGAPAGLVTALALAGFEAIVLELSWFGDRAVALPLGEAFHQKRLQLRSSQVGTVAAAQRPRWTPRRRLTTALALLADPALDALIDGESRFDELPRLMPALAAGSALCHRIAYHDL